MSPRSQAHLVYLCLCGELAVQLDLAATALHRFKHFQAVVNLYTPRIYICTQVYFFLVRLLYQVVYITPNATNATCIISEMRKSLL